MSLNIQFKSRPIARLNGEINVPGDKSISHRAIMLGAIAEGVSEISGFLFGADNLATLGAFQQLGVSIETDNVTQKVRLNGVGLKGLQVAAGPLDLGNSGTAMRLMCGLLAGQRFSSTLIGDASLLRRPMARVVEPLIAMGAKIHLSPDGTAPIMIHGDTCLKSIVYQLPMASAQVKSALLLAGLYAKGGTTIVETAVTRDHTEKMLRTFQYPIIQHNRFVRLTGGTALKATSLKVPGDISSAAFFMVAASIVPQSELFLPDVGINPTRTGVINILRSMGADIRLSNQRMYGYEPVADITVRYAPLHGIDIPSEQVPLAIDEWPVLMVAAACACGQTILKNAEELRVKESDRIATMAVGLQALGIVCAAQPDGIVIQGGRFSGGVVDSGGDHRVAMAFAVAACVAEGEVVIDDCANVQTSFPNFCALANSIGCDIQ